MVISTAKRRRRVDYPKSEAQEVPSTESQSDASSITPAVFLVLLALADGEAHGYGIMQEVLRITGGDTRLGPGTLYRSIQRMLVGGLIEELDIALDGEADDVRRRHYRVTRRGRSVAGTHAQRLALLVDAARARKILARNSCSN